MTQNLTDAEIDGLSGKGESLLRERAVTVGKSGSDAIVACDNGDDATAVWAYLESLGVSQQPTLTQHIDRLRLEWVDEFDTAVVDCVTHTLHLKSDAVTPLGNYRVIGNDCYVSDGENRWLQIGAGDSRDNAKEMGVSHYQSRVRAIFKANP